MSVVVNQPYSTYGNGGRKLVRLSNGWEVAVAYSSTSKTNYFYIDRNNGFGFEQLCYMTSSNEYDSVALVSHGTNVHVVRGGTNVSSVFFNYFDALTVQNVNVNGQRFIAVDSNQTTVNSVSLAIDPSNGHLHACWSSKNSTYPNSFNIRYSKSTDGGVTWSAVTQVTKESSENRNPSIVIVNGIPIITHDRYLSGTNQNLISIRRFNGSSWDMINVYNGGSFTQSSPSAVVDKDGVIHVAWRNSQNSYIDYAKSIDGGVSWTVGTTAMYGNNPSISIDKNNTLMILADYSNNIRMAYKQKGLTYFLYDTSFGVGTNPSTLFDVTFRGVFGDIPPTIYQAPSSVEYIGTYLTNQAPTLTLTDSNHNPITNSQTIKHTNKTPFLFRILANDSDENDTLEYSIWLRNAEYQTWTSISKGVETEIEIPSEQFLLGNNNIEIKVRDSQGDLVSSLFVVRNLTPESYSQKHVYDLIVGYM